MIFKRIEYSICTECVAVTYKYSDGFLYRPNIEGRSMCRPGKCKNTVWIKCE